MGCSTPKAELVVRAYFDALNQHDREAVIGFYAPEFVLENPDAGFRLDRSEVEPIVDWDLALNCMYTIESLKREPDGIRVVVRETNDLFQLLSREPLTLECVYAVEGGLLRSQRFRVLDGDPNVGAALAPVVEWAKQRHPKVLIDIYPQGQLVFTADAAVLWVSLLEEWRETTSAE